MPLRGRTRISGTGPGRNGESAMRASSTTVPLTLGSRLNMLSVRRFSGAFFLVVEHPAQKRSSLTLTTAQQRTTTHENSNSVPFFRGLPRHAKPCGEGTPPRAPSDQVGDDPHETIVVMTSAIPGHEKLHLRSSNLIYFSPTIGVRLTLGALVQGMLVRLGERLSPGCVVHSDRGRRYRTPDWESGCGAAGIVRSMSRRGHSPDNAAMETFFGRLKVELFHGRDWSGWTVGRFAGELGRTSPGTTRGGSGRSRRATTRSTAGGRRWASRPSPSKKSSASSCCGKTKFRQFTDETSVDLRVSSVG